MDVGIIQIGFANLFFCLSLLTSNLTPLKSVRLACVRHAASVRPEPGSNSPVNLFKVCDFFSLHELIGSNFSRLTSSLNSIMSLSATLLIEHVLFTLFSSQ